MLNFNVTIKELQLSLNHYVALKMKIVNVIDKRTLSLLRNSPLQMLHLNVKWEYCRCCLKKCMYRPVFLVPCLESANLGGSATLCLNASILKSTFEVNCQGMARYHQVLPGRPLATNWQANTELILAPQNSVSAVSRHSHLTVRRSFDFREFSERTTT